MGNDAPAEPIRRIAEERPQIEDKRLDVSRDSLASPKDSAYKATFQGISNEAAEQHVVKLGFPKGSDVANFKSSSEAGADASDRFHGISESDAKSAYTGTLERAGLNPTEAAKVATETMDRFKAIKDGGENHLNGTPAEQMARINKAMGDILDKTGVSDGRLADGQPDKLSASSRQDAVKDLAARMMDPEKFAVQGQHFTCVLQSRQKQLLQGGDIARVAELTAGVTNNGFAEVKQLDGKTRTVHVNSESIRPDEESKFRFDSTYHGSMGKRGMAGQVWDALAGQTMADLKSERKGETTSASGIENASRVYMAAHADARGFDAQTKTGEGLFKRDPRGGYDLMENNPGAAAWDIAHLNRAMGGNESGVLMHRNLVNGERPPAGFPQDLHITTFGSTAEAKGLIAQHESRTGQSVQITVDAPFLPGGGADGHGLHAMNAAINKDTGKIDLDNNWASGQDLKSISDDQFDRATNPENWDVPNRPTADTIFGPGTGRNPNETAEDAERKREEDSKRKQDELDEERKKQEEKRKKEEADAEERRKLDEEKIVKLNRKIQELYDQQMAVAGAASASPTLAQMI